MSSGFAERYRRRTPSTSELMTPAVFGPSLVLTAQASAQVVSTSGSVADGTRRLGQTHRCLYGSRVRSSCEILSTGDWPLVLIEMTRAVLGRHRTVRAMSSAGKLEPPTATTMYCLPFAL